MMIKKVTVGFVVQEFDDSGKFLRQEFVAGDQVDYENEMGEPLEDYPECYFPFEMKQCHRDLGE